MKRHKINHFLDTLNVYANVTTGLGALLLSAFGKDYQIALGASIGMGANTVLKAIERKVRGAEKVPKEIGDFMYLYTAQKQGIVS